MSDTSASLDPVALARAEERARKKREKLEQMDREVVALDAAKAALRAHKEAEDAMTPDAVTLDAAADGALDALAAAFGVETLSDSRRTALRLAAATAGVGMDVLRAICTAARLAMKDTIVLPSGRYAGLSRGQGWCRNKGTGAWADRNEHKVGPGTWIVGSNDGFKRKDCTDWIVIHVQVGDCVWTLAS